MNTAKKKKLLLRQSIISFKKLMLPYFYLLMVIVLLLASPITSWLPRAFAQEATVIETTTVEAPQPILLSIQYGKGGAVQEYPVNSGEAVFIQAGPANNPSLNVNPQEVKETDAYRQQLGVLSDQIAQKIGAIQKKQRESDTEVYMVYKTPLDIERAKLESDLRTLEARRDQLTSQRTAKESLKPTVPPQPPATVATGMTVKASIAGGKANITIQSKGGQIQSSIAAPLDTWVQIFSAEKGQSQDIWAKVAPRKQ